MLYLLKVGGKMEIKIEKLDHQGRGIGFLNEKIVFVPFALPGDVVDIELVKEKKNFCEGNIIKFIEKGSMHIENKCPYFEICGGCDLRHISYEDELKFKENKVKEILNKFTKQDIKVNNIVGSETQEFYRNKIKFTLDKKLGLIKRNSHDIIKIDKCLIADLKINELISEINKCNLNNIESVTVRKSYFTSDIMLIVDISNDKIMDKSLTKLEKYVDSLIFTQNDIIIKIIGKSNIIEKLNNLTYKISPNSFFQVNSRQAVKLYDLVLEKAALTGSEIVYDLFCGTGTIGLYLSSLAKKVIGVEINKSAIRDANENKKINNIENVDFYAEDVTKFVDRKLDKPDVVVFDPPRAGLNKKIIDTIKSFNPKKIVYVSCDPVTLARDLKDFSDKYEIVDVTPVDMFPRTYHVESVALLSLKTLEK